jgi:hypothetical protein
MLSIANTPTLYLSAHENALGRRAGECLVSGWYDYLPPWRQATKGTDRSTGEFGFIVRGAGCKVNLAAGSSSSLIARTTS